MIVGLTGTKAGGKGEVAKILIEKGFLYSSLSDIVREEAAKRGMVNYTITDLQNIGNELRQKEGLGVLAKRVLEKTEAGKNYVIDGIRNLGEIEELKKRNAVIIAVDAPKEKRFEFLIKRARQSDPKTRDDFEKMEARDLGLGEENFGQQVSKCMEKADYKIYNDSSLEELKKKILEIIDKIEKSNKRPSWDEYFLEIGKSVARRATCDRGKVSCVIARNKQILVAGYAGSPIGLPHCDEIGHQMKEVKHEDGSVSQHCMRTVHAEQNAICQAAKLGIAIDRGTLYCNMTPCSACAKMIINAGIKRVVCEKRYHQGKESEELFEKAGIKLEILNDVIEKYEKQ